MPRTLRRAGAGAVAVLGIAVGLACAEPAELRYEEALARAPAPAEHAVHSERLAELMAGLERLSADARLPQALDLEVARTRRIQEVRKHARAIAHSADRIPATAGPDVAPLDPAERQTFDALAAELAARARRLASDADVLSDAALRERLAALQVPCEQCHARFRIPR